MPLPFTKVPNSLSISFCFIYAKGGKIISINVGNRHQPLQHSYGPGFDLMQKFTSKKSEILFGNLFEVNPQKVRGQIAVTISDI